MQDQPTRGPALAPAEIDDQMQMAVITYLLTVYPAQLTAEEIVIAFSNPADGSFGERELIERAVRDLACSGVLHRHGEFVVPTRAAARLAALVGL